MNRNFLASAVILASLFTTSKLFAAISGPFTTSTPIPLTLTDWSLGLDFPKFNSALGTLISVELDLSGSLSTIITVTNSALSSSSGTAKTEVQYTVQDGGLNLIAP